MGEPNELYARIFEVVRAIPRGEVITYGGIAELIGLKNGARRVGYAMHCAPEDLPWHRVVGLSRKGFGKITIADPMTADLQRALLESEGVSFNEKGEIALNF